MVKIDTNDLISMKEAANIRKVTLSSISELVKRGRLSFVEIGGHKFLKRDEVSNFVESKGGRPRKKKAGDEK